MEANRVRFSDFGFSLSEMIEEIENLIKVDNLNPAPNKGATPMLWGSFGLGKTEGCKQVSRNIEYELRTINLSTLSPVDVRGIPAISEDSTNFKFLPPEFVPVEEPVRSFNKETEKDKFESFLNEIFDINLRNTFQLFNYKGEYVIEDNMKYHQFYETNKNVIVNADTSEGNKKFFSLTHKFIITETQYIVQKLPVLLFFDEINTAPQSTQVVAYEICLERKMGNTLLPKYQVIDDNGEIVSTVKTSVIMAGNKSGDKGAIHPMPMPLANRCFHLNIKVEPKDIIDYFIDINIDPLIISYLKQNPNDCHVMEGDVEVMRSASTGKIIPAVPSPRTWEMMDRYLSMYKSFYVDKETGQMRHKNTATEKDYQRSCAMTVGETIAQKLKAYVKYAHHIPDFYNNLCKVEPEPFHISSDKKDDVGFKYFYILSLAQAYWYFFTPKYEYIDTPNEAKAKIINEVITNNLITYIKDIKADELRSLFISLIKNNKDQKKSLDIITYWHNTASLDELSNMLNKVLGMRKDDY